MPSAAQVCVPPPPCQVSSAALFHREEAVLVKVVEFQRQRGGVVDRETLALLAKKVMSRMRGIGVHDTIYID